MENQKAENLLNLALETPEAEREKTEELNVGYDPETGVWDIIVKYYGELGASLAASFPQARMRELLNGFAILSVPENQVEDVLRLPEIEYAEKPKRLFFAMNRARAASCLLPVQSAPGEVDGAPGNLSGKGVLLAVIDSGIDYFHEDFRRPGGDSRILYLADQVTGAVYGKAEIDAALRTGSRAAARELVPSLDGSGHGTAVAGIAAGNGRESKGLYRGVAYESDLIVVRLGIPRPDGFPRTTELMEGLDFAVRAALNLGRPMAVNVSFGNTYGSHDGGGLLEWYLDGLAEMGRSVFAVGMGNEGEAGGHGRFYLQEGETETAELSVGQYERGFGLQIWKSYESPLELVLRNPAGTVAERIREQRGAYRFRAGGTDILVYYGEPSPFQPAQEIYLEFLPVDRYVESGIWKLSLRGRGQVDLWLPSAGALNRDTRLLTPSPETTLTIPATAMRPISVGAYDDSTDTYAAFSGRGDTRQYRIQKPDLVAPGVDIITVQNGGGYGPVTGTSFAAPFVTGAAALLMEWGIVMGNDPYLYGDKVKAYLRWGARRLPAEREYPNPRLGYGALCVAASFPSPSSGGSF